VDGALGQGATDPHEGQARYARVPSLLSSHWARGDDAGKFARTLGREVEHLWGFLVEEGVAPTNNRAERSLRFAVLWRKMMQGTSSDKGDRWVECILSLRETWRLRSRPTFPILVDAGLRQRSRAGPCLDLGVYYPLNNYISLALRGVYDE
jgi:transposase